MELTEYHAKYLAHELTKRRASDTVEKLAQKLEHEPLFSVQWRLA